MLADTKSSPVEQEHLSDTCFSTLEIGAAQLRSVTEIAPKSPSRNHQPLARAFMRDSLRQPKQENLLAGYPAQFEHCLTLQLHYLRWFTLYNKIYFWNIKSSCCDICGYQTTNFSITKTLPSQQNMIDDQLCLTREPIEQLISVELFASCVPPLAQFPPLSGSDLVLSREERRSMVKSPKSPFRLFRLTMPISSLLKDDLIIA